MFLFKDSSNMIPLRIQTKFIHKLYMDNISVKLESHNFSENLRVVPLENLKKSVNIFLLWH
jgi:hypothetical protein